MKRLNKKKRTGFALLILFMFILSAISVSALGLRPAKTEIEYLPGIEQKFSFKIVNDDGLQLDLNALVVKEISPYIKLEREEIVIEEDVSFKEFFFSINLPEDLPPGPKTSRIVIEEQIAGEGSSNVRTRIRIHHKVTTLVPQTQGYLTVDLNSVDKQASLEIETKIKNNAEEQLEGIKTRFLVINNGVKIKERVFDEISIESKALEILKSEIEKDFGNGEYEIISEVVHEDQLIEISKTFTIGSPELRIDNVKKYLVEKKINDLDFEIENYWNTGVEEISIHSLLTKGTIKLGEAQTPIFALKPREARTITQTLDLRNVPRGDYALKFRIKKGELEQIKEEVVSVLSEEEFAKISKGSNKILYLIVGFLILVVIILLIIVTKRK